MNRHEFEPDKHQHKMEEEEYNYWGAVYNEAHRIVKENDRTACGRIYKMPYDKKYLFDVMREQHGKKGRGCYRPASALFNEMFVSKGGCTYELLAPKFSPTKQAF